MQETSDVNASRDRIDEGCQAEQNAAAVAEVMGVSRARAATSRESGGAS